ncbi:MAG TPA: prenyltransferase/squalene oxidase repeat-containing protein [Isosphaeraceae bacterium]
MLRCHHFGSVLVVLVLVPAIPRAAPVEGPEGPAVACGLRFLKANGPGQATGEAALAAMALIRAEVPAADPDLAACLAKIQARFHGSTYMPERSGGSDIYEAAVVLMALAGRDPGAHRGPIEAAAQYLLAKQKPSGGWDYDTRTLGDSSITQYAVLGLWEAETAGVPVPPRVWEGAAAWYMATQRPSGGWVYHADEPGRPETVSMTAAGVGSLMICQRQLNQYRRPAVDVASPLLTPLVPDAGAPPRYAVRLSVARVDAAIRKGTAWLAHNLLIGDGPIMGQSAPYGLYGLERIGALGDRPALGRRDWYAEGRRFLLASQQANGSWKGSYAEVANTAWAVLFLTRATVKTVAKATTRAPSLGAGTLLGGRGLPEDLASLTVAGGHVVVRPMNGAIEGMLEVLEDPRVEDADAALAGLVARYRAEGAPVLRPLKDRFRKLLADPDPGVRRVAAWALARTGDLDVAPALIAALEDPDAAVVAEARLGLQLLSRKLDGLGPPPDATPEQRREAARRWRAWYASARDAGR